MYCSQGNHMTAEMRESGIPKPIVSFGDSQEPLADVVGYLQKLPPLGIHSVIIISGILGSGGMVRRKKAQRNINLIRATNF